MTATTHDIEQQTDKPTGQKSKYVIFKRLPNTERPTWVELGEVEADGAYAAREEAVKRYNLMEEIREGTLEMVSLGRRFWMPKQPKVNVSESLDVS